MIDVALAIEGLVPSAQYEGSVTDNTQQSFVDLKWTDPRPKPKWYDLIEFWDGKEVALKWEAVDVQRAALMTKHQWRVDRYTTQVAASIPTSETEQKFIEICVYFQTLRDLPQTYAMPDDVVWPVEP